MELCIKCEKKPVKIRKRQLCTLCYSRFRRNRNLERINKKIKEWGEPITPITKIKHQHFREMMFIKNYFTHNNWQHQPVMFRLNGEKYNPDFYDGERNIFIEVAGSRQAYEQNKKKYDQMKILFPKIRFEIRTPDGRSLIIDDKLKVAWPEGFHEQSRN
jgi:hypothetical protein